MRFKNIIYKLEDKAIMPEVMGTVATDLYDWTISFKRYEEIIPEVEKVMEICKDFNNEDEFKDIVTEEEAPFGFFKKYVHFFIIETTEETSVTYFPRIDCADDRHWLNGKIAFIGHDHTIYTVTLKKGYNIFCFEHSTEGIPYVRIEKTYNAENTIFSLTKDNYWYNPGNFVIRTKTESIQENKIFEFSIIPVDLINLNYESKIKMIVRLGMNGPILYETDVNFKQEYKMDLSFIPNMQEDEFERLVVYFQVEGVNGRIFKKYIMLYRYDVKPEYAEKMKKVARDLLDKDHVPELIKNEIHYLIKQLSSIENNFYHGRYLKNVIEAEKKNALSEYLFKSGPHYIYYYCNEDDNYYYYYVVLPKDFDPSKKYPLLLNFSHGHVDHFSDIHYSSNYSSHFAEREGAIYADIGGRGCTLGSYMGEVFLLNEIEHLLKHFPIDTKKIYAFAHCAGNKAILNFAQTHPHLFAGIYVRTGRFYEPNINNLYNVHCMYLIAALNEKASDPIHILRKKVEKELRKFDYLYVPNFNSDELMYAQFTEPAINMLMSEELNEYPEIIYYRTERNRARKAYYIEIESIEEGKGYAEFSSEIVTYNLVIETKNCTGLKITLPPQIDKENFVIKINGKTLKFKGYDKYEVLLKHHKKRGFEVVNNLNEEICYYKGTGLLDVYFSPLRIINCDFKDDILSELSDKFAHPKTNTAYPYVYVDYPIKTIDDISNYTEYSLIIVDNNCHSNENLNSIRSQLPIQMDNKGYSYNTNNAKCKYCIMQVIANPQKKDRSILYINTNDKKLYDKNLFTRQLLIPTYGNGYHPFLNGVALMFDGKKYYTVKEWGEDFIEVK